MEIALFQDDEAQIKKVKTDLSEFLDAEARVYADQLWKPNMIKDEELRAALAKEYSRRLKLYLRSFPNQKRIQKYLKKKSVIDLSWRELEKLVNHLKKKGVR